MVGNKKHKNSYKTKGELKELLGLREIEIQVLKSILENINVNFKEGVMQSSVDFSEWKTFTADNGDIHRYGAVLITKNGENYDRQ